MYATYQQYVDNGGYLISAEDFPKWASRASARVDSLTFNRIRQRKFSNLTGFQQEQVVLATCRQTDFEFENSDVIDSIVGSYSLNGVSVSFTDSPGSVSVMGMLVSRDVLGALESTGLTCLAMRW